MANAIEARGLRKRFGKATALDGLDHSTEQLLPVVDGTLPE